ncbi:sigma-54 interaction domain-containing protein [Paraburkholderia sp. 35.1]|uniref:sigma-54 interaction domain-containing protein n=1 Tax=Paraburkholderia sp. 35.1 TaxID=2991058 RepID=UPI003D22CB0C
MHNLARFNLFGQSQQFLAAMAVAEKFAACDLTVLIAGETGTGKELVARAIHYLSARRDRPFIPVNCGALPETLVECELFGHVRGAFTDARETRQGLVAQADGGTLFLDEIEAMNARAQVSLLRFLQDKEYRPVGSSGVRCADVRIVGTSNADLSSMVRRGAFRHDLLYRLNVLALHLPPLRERDGDVAVLAQTFLERLNQRSSLPPKAFRPDTFDQLHDYFWPGNVRELENLVSREFILTNGGELSISSVSRRGDAWHINGPRDESCAAQPLTIGNFKSAKARAVADFERSYIEALLSKSHGNLSLASRLSGKDRSDLGKLLRKHGITRQDFN